MNLQTNFYKIIDRKKTATGIDYTIGFNADHCIYRAHFPNNPITPGVCIIQIIKELSAELLQRNLFLKKVNHVKFLNVINPIQNSETTFSISVSSPEDNKYKVETYVYNDIQQFAKLNILFTNE